MPLMGTLMGEGLVIQRERIPFRVRPMLATLTTEPFQRPGWVYEEKYDGYRMFAYKEGSRVVLLSRTAHDRTRTFPEIAAAVAGLESQSLLLDGEIVAFDRKQVSRFQLLQQGNAKVIYAVFDCLYMDGYDLRLAPLAARRVCLESAVNRTARTLPARRLARDGLAAYRAAKRRGFEGIIAKDSLSLYEERRSTKWLKVKVHQEEEFVVVGYTRPTGSRSHFGSLLLGAYKGGALHYVGKVGTGFSQRTLSSLWKRFQPLVVDRPRLTHPPRERGVTWLAERLVAQIAFQEWTRDVRLRQPAFLGLRDDKRPTECRVPEGMG
jgi:bifunctional non-homologous end joining protein LigD